MNDPNETLNQLTDNVDWPDVDTRLERLRSLRKAMLRHREEIQKAVWEDFRKPPIEADLTEILPVLLEIKTALRHLKSWAAPDRLRGSFPLWGLSSRMQYRPKGRVLIISPWNYPFNLSLGPLVSALAAGNAVVLKPSERAPHSSALIRAIVDDALPGEVASVLEGGPELGGYLLDHPFDHFFFTGGARVGKLVMRAAAEHLSTTTLELGGKSPAIVDGTVDLEECAEKIVRGKFLNGGQTCIAPDYVVVRDQVFARFVDEAMAAAARFEEATEMSSPADELQRRHLEALLEDARTHGAVARRPGHADLGLTIVTGVPLSCRLMQEEIFGPILPILRYRSHDELNEMLARNPTPLTVYAFSKDETFIQRLVKDAPTGCLCVNETLLHFVHPRIPFGGVGRSGFGRSHGQAGFETFSNAFPIMRQNFRKGIIPLLYPPRGRLQEYGRSILFKIFGD